MTISFKCPICDDAVVSLGGLNWWHEYYHDQNKDKTIKCDGCHRWFSPTAVEDYWVERLQEALSKEARLEEAEGGEIEVGDTELTVRELVLVNEICRLVNDTIKYKRDK